MKTTLTKSKKEYYRSLTIYELNVLLPILIKGLQTKNGKKNAVTAKHIVHSLRKHNVKINNTSVKVIVNYIRVNDLIAGLMASNSGYYITKSEQELKDYEDSLQKREAVLRKVRVSMKRQRNLLISQKREELLKQTQLF